MVGDEIYLADDDARHLATVLRMAEGEHIIACDGAGADYLCVLTDMGRGGAGRPRARVLRIGACAGEPSVRVSLYQSLLKSEKFEFVIQKCTEAGVHTIIPVVSERVQFAGRMKGEDGVKRMARWRRIAKEAAKQSGRGIIPEVRDCVDFSEAARECGQRVNESPGNRLAIVMYEREKSATLKSKLEAYKQRMLAVVPGHAPAPPNGDGSARTICEISLFVGPEGGYSADEINCCEQHSISAATLGPRILRAETAGLATLCQIMYEFEQ
ncbi:MAG: 16S rRNA (uracil(1498)-N(3))-methyltransferase [Oscillospiraceae bacterium]|nr:16S rRNA (uracil(1498)-N(3))-methyltransferase [Oscillospiraceae bacterium]